MSILENNNISHSRREEFSSNNDVPIGAISSYEMSARYISFSDKFQENRKEFIKSVFNFVQSYDYHEGNTKFISSAYEDYQVFVIGGNDLPRVASILKQYDPALTRKLKICFTKSVSAGRRAQILAAGCDDVIDIDRINPTEAAARIRRMWNRYKQSNEISDELGRMQTKIEHACNKNSLSRTEREIVLHLLNTLEKPGANYAPYYILQQAAGRDYGEVTRNHLKVIISGIRKKLDSSYVLKSETGLGYKLLRVIF